MSYHTPWTDAHEASLRSHVAASQLSYSGIANALNEEFDTRYSRQAAIGKASRLGLKNTYYADSLMSPRKPRKPQHYKPRPKRDNAPTIDSFAYRTMECSEVIPQHVSANDLAENGCRWPYGDGPFTFCNHPQFGDSSYCGPHQRLSERRFGS